MLNADCPWVPSPQQNSISGPCRKSSSSLLTTSWITLIHLYELPCECCLSLIWSQILELALWIGTVSLVHPRTMTQAVKQISQRNPSTGLVSLCASPVHKINNSSQHTLSTHSVQYHSVGSNTGTPFPQLLNQLFFLVQLFAMSSIYTHWWITH